MFMQKQSYFSRLAKSYPILKLVDIYDRQSFIRAYVLDNVYVCILMHALFYVALWYATTVIKKMEKSNKKMLKIVEENRTKLDDVMAMKDKKTEYDELVVKVKETQKLTSEELESQMQRLSAELITATNKLSELEQIVEKLIFSTSPAGKRATVLRATSLTDRAPIRKRSTKDGRNRSRISRYSSRPSRHLYRRNLHPGSMGSLSVDLLANVVHLPRLQLQLQPPKSDSSNYASVEASSESAVHRRRTGVIWSGGDRRHKERNWKRYDKFANSTIRFNARKQHNETMMNLTPFTRSLLGLVTIFTRDKS
ncbi:hypothetical protein ANTQUA_LOCUS4017 [Anthophora quadrimaculata]